jgi:competence protein ComEA
MAGYFLSVAAAAPTDGEVELVRGGSAQNDGVAGEAAAQNAAGAAAPAGQSEPQGADGTAGVSQAAGSGAGLSEDAASGAAVSGAAGESAAGFVYGAQTDGEVIYVYVTGAVKNPGVYELARSSMIVDAVELAGGFTEQADAENVNMVYRLESNAMLNIKRKPEQSGADADADGGGSAPASASGLAPTAANTARQYGDAAEISYGYDDILLSPDAAAGTGSEPRLNLNTATLAQLQTLPGIGEATAKKIIAYREKNQRFLQIEELMNISGIKQAKFDGLKDQVTV